MENPFDLSAFIAQSRSLPTPPPARAEDPVAAFSAWCVKHHALVDQVVSALTGTNLPHFFLAMHEPGNPLPKKFIEVLQEQPALSLFEDSSRVPGPAFLDLLSQPRPAESLSRQWDNAP